MLRIRTSSMKARNGSLAAYPSKRGETTQVEPQQQDEPSRRPEHQLSLLFDIMVISDRAGELLNRGLRGTGLRAIEYGIYSILRRQGSTTPSLIARLIGMPPSTLSSYLNVMVSRGHAHRVTNTQDGRSSLIALTAAGVDTHEQARLKVAEVHRTLAQHLRRPPDEFRETLANLAASLQDALDDRGNPRSSQ
jgi:DNA-binding MarR family transcriptional regulator